MVPAEKNVALFFELLRVAIGNADSLSCIPSNKEWKALYDMAEKQSLVGVCFAALQRLGADADEGFVRIGISEMLYLTWMGMAAQIQRKNQIVDRQCIALQKRISACGMRSSILKGQGVGLIYAEHLRGLRQSGDIDIYVDCGLEKAVAWAKKEQKDVRWDYKHLHLEFFEDTEVEIHYRPEYLANLWHNHKLQKWVKANLNHAFGRNVKLGNGEISTPDTVFNSLYVLIHIYNHNFRAGVGLRQLMDYYYVISERVMTDDEKNELCVMLSKLGMDKYASGIMWIMREVFGMKEDFLVCSANEDEGRYILDGVMIGGNMGRGYKRLDKDMPFALRFFTSTMRYFWRSLGRYPLEAISYPIWTVYHFVWKRFQRLK